MRGRNEQGIIFEFIVIGSYVKVSAVDTRTGTEVSIVGDPKRGEQALRQIARRKLEMVLAKAAKPPRRGGAERLTRRAGRTVQPAMEPLLLRPRPRPMRLAKLERCAE